MAGNTEQKVSNKFSLIMKRDRDGKIGEIVENRRLIVRLARSDFEPIERLLDKPTVSEEPDFTEAEVEQPSSENVALPEKRSDFEPIERLLDKPTVSEEPDFTEAEVEQPSSEHVALPEKLKVDNEESDFSADDSVKDKDYQLSRSSSSSSSSDSSPIKRSSKEKLMRVQNVKKQIFLESQTKSPLPVESSSHVSPARSESPDFSSPEYSNLSPPSSQQTITRVSQSSASPENSSLVAASFEISQHTSEVKFKSQMKMHKGYEYRCNLDELDEKFVGFLPSYIPHMDHKCEFYPVGDTNRWTCMMMRRKQHELQVVVRAMYCVPTAEFEGKECELESGEFTAPLFLIRTHEGISSSDKASKKRHCCCYCSKMFVHISRHLISQHSKESDVRMLMEHKANSFERNNALKKLRLKGDAIYNKSVPVGKRLTIRRPLVAKTSECVHCPKCQALLAPRNFSRHERKCTGRAPNRERVVAASRMQEQVSRHPKDSRLKTKLMKVLLEPLKNDPVAHEIYSDLCLQQLAERYAFMHSNNPTALKNDRQHLRRLARLLVEIREVDPTVLDFEDCILNVSYDSVIESVFRLCGMDRDSAVFKYPSLAQVLRSALTMLIRTLQNYYLNKGLLKTSVECINTDRFLTLHNENYGIYIGRAAGRHRLHRKTRQQMPLPQPQDIKKFSTYIASEARKAYEDLGKKEFSYATWMRLGQAELTRLIVFNRRRVSEVALMQVDLFHNRRSLDASTRERLTVLEKALADKYKIMSLLAKRAHVLNVLLDEEQCRHLELFLRLREKAGVKESNEYLFGVPTNCLYIDPSYAMRKFSVECGAENPKLLRATYLRKQVATMSQLLALNDNEIGQIARFMGHSKDVHNNFYRQDVQLTQVTAWAKFLSLASDEDFNKYKGLSLQEIVNEMVAAPMTQDDDSEPENENPIVAPLEDVTVDEMMQVIHETENFRPEVSTPTPSERLRQQKKPTPRKSPKKSPKKSPVKSPKRPLISDILHRLTNSPRAKVPKRKPFTADETRLMTLQFQKYISAGCLTPMNCCDELVEKYSAVFVGRSGRDLYNWVQYQRNKKKRSKK